MSLWLSLSAPCSDTVLPQVVNLIDVLGYTQPRPIMGRGLLDRRQGFLRNSKATLLLLAYAGEGLLCREWEIPCSSFTLEGVTP